MPHRELRIDAVTKREVEQNFSSTKERAEMITKDNKCVGRIGLR